jgi:hypothetical protein
MIELMYIERDGNPVNVAADIVTRHPNQTITFAITSPEWKARIGWSPTSHVEVQAEPVGQVNREDRYYWVDRIKIKSSYEPLGPAPLRQMSAEEAAAVRPGADPEGRLRALREFLELYSDAPDSWVDTAFTKALRGALASSQKIDWPVYAWNMLDLLVHSAGGSTSAILALEIVLEGHPETEMAKAARRKGLTMQALEIK